MIATLRSALGLVPLPWQGSWLILFVGYAATLMLAWY